MAGSAESPGACQGWASRDQAGGLRTPPNLSPPQMGECRLCPSKPFVTHKSVLTTLAAHCNHLGTFWGTNASISPAEAQMKSGFKSSPADSNVQPGWRPTELSSPRVNKRFRDWGLGQGCSNTGSPWSSASSLGFFICTMGDD